MVTVQYEKGVDGLFYPSTQDTVKDPRQFELPEGTQTDFQSLMAICERKYAKDFLKVCAYHNKLFPTLRASSQVVSAHIALPFTVTSQEANDVGTGLSANYLKIITEMIVSRLGVKTFEYKLLMETPSLSYVLYKDEVERTLRALVRKRQLEREMVVVFQNAAMLAHAHIFMDPYTNEMRRLADWELGCYDTEFSVGKLKRVVIWDPDFPVSELRPYLSGFKKEDIEGVLHTKSVVLKIYIDCYAHKTYVVCNYLTGPEKDYPFDNVQIETFSWDIGVKKAQVGSLFDLLYSMQRAIDKFLAKESMLITSYKGPVPVFSKDVGVELRNIGNGAGEALFLTAPGIDPASIVTTIEPTPLDSKMDSSIEQWKQKMFELAGVQQVSLDIEQYRSAAAMIALEQMRDANFQPQLQGIADFLRRVIVMQMKWFSVVGGGEEFSLLVDWSVVKELLDEAVLDVKAVHRLEATGGVESGAAQVDYKLLNADRFVVSVCKGEKSFEDISFMDSFEMLKALAAVKLMQISVLKGAGEGVDRLQRFLVQCFVEDIRMGVVNLNE